MKTAVQETSPLLVSKSEAARLLGVSVRTLHDLTKAGKIPHVRLGVRGIRYSVRALEQLIEQQIAATSA